MHSQPQCQPRGKERKKGQPSVSRLKNKQLYIVTHQLLVHWRKRNRVQQLAALAWFTSRLHRHLKEKHNSMTTRNINNCCENQIPAVHDLRYCSCDPLPPPSHQQAAPIFISIWFSTFNNCLESSQQTLAASRASTSSPKSATRLRASATCPCNVANWSALLACNAALASSWSCSSLAYTT